MKAINLITFQLTQYTIQAVNEKTFSKTYFCNVFGFGLITITARPENPVIVNTTFSLTHFQGTSMRVEFSLFFWYEYRWYWHENKKKCMNIYIYTYINYTINKKNFASGSAYENYIIMSFFRNWPVRRENSSNWSRSMVDPFFKKGDKTMLKN